MERESKAASYLELLRHSLLEGKRTAMVFQVCGRAGQGE